MPISEKQLAANRANAQKSTGPRTPEGRARSAANSLRHGLYARAVLIPGEDPEEFQAFARDFFDALQPADGLESSLVGRLATVSWRLRRVADAEYAAFIPASAPEEPAALPSAPHSPEQLSEKTSLPAPAPAEFPGVSYVRRLRPGADPLAGLSRHEARLHRQFCRDFALFRTAREIRREREKEAECGRNPMAGRRDKWGQHIGKYSTFPLHRQLLDLETELGLHGPEGPPP